MRKLSALFLVVLAVLFSASIAFAGSADARTANYGQGISSVVGVGDVSAGNTLEVDSNGSASVQFAGNTVGSATGITLLAGTQLVTGVANIQSLTLSGDSTTIGDYILFYDNTSATGTPKWEVTAATAEGTYTVPAYGAKVTNGLFAVSNNDQVFTTVVYKQ